MSNAVQASYGGSGDAFAAGLSPSGTLLFSTYAGGSGFDGFWGLAVSGAGLHLAGATNSSSFWGNSSTSPDGWAIVTRLGLDGRTVAFTTTLPGASSFLAIALDGAGSIYLTGETSGQLPVTPNAFQPAGLRSDAFAAKLNSSGTQWLYVSHLGGSAWEAGYSLAVDGSGTAYIAGATLSGDFPVKNAFDAVLEAFFSDAFLAAVNPSGTGLTFSTYLGRSGYDDASSVVVLPGGNIVVGGYASLGFPAVAAWRSYPAGGFFAKFTPAGTLLYSSFLGAQIHGLAAASNGSVVIAGDIGAQLAPIQEPPERPVTPQAFDTTPNGEIDALVARFADGPPPVSVTITSLPAGRQVTVDGVAVTTPAVLSWQPGTPHTLDATSPQRTGQNVYTFTSWSHGGGATQNVTAPSNATSYTANYGVAPCSYAFVPSSITIGFEGINYPSRAMRMETQYDCPSPAPASNASWLTVDSPSIGRSGPFDLYFSIGVNRGAPRTATITAGPATLTVTQRGSAGSLPSPAFLSPQDNQFVITRGLGVSWQPVAGAVGYELSIVQVSSFQRTVVHYGGQSANYGTFANIDLSYGNYEVYLRSCSTVEFGDANCGLYSMRRVTVQLDVPQAASAIIFPQEGQVLRTSTHRLRWQPVADATSYEVTLLQTGNFQPVLQINTREAETIFTMKSTTYVLFVTPCRAACRASPSQIYFTVSLPRVSQDPPTGLTTQITGGNTLNLSWNPVTNADLYRVQVVQPNAGPGGGALTVAARQVSTTNASLQVPAGAATVVLNACNGDGCGPPSTIAVNPTGPNPSVPIVATPMPVVVADGPNITISWSRIPGDNGSNTDYRLYVGDLSRDGPALDVITKNNFYGAFLRAEGRRYDALVFATQNGVTVTGPASGFMVAGSSATAPLITSPTHNSTFKQGPIRLAWSPIPDAARYQYYVGRQGQTGPALTGVTPGLFVDTTLSVTAPTLHQAIVRACPSANANQCSPDSDAGWGPWSQSVTGTTSFTITP